MLPRVGQLLTCPGITRTTALLLAAVLVAALATRIVFAGWVVGWYTPGKGDELQYHSLAKNIAEGRGFVSAPSRIV